MLVIWWLRGRPARTRACGLRRVTSTPLKTMRPTSVGSTPEICAMRVVLPAPLGPISACTSPRMTSSVTSSVATTPPKRLETPRSSSMGFLQQSGDALGRQHHDGEQHNADGEPGVVLVVRRERSDPADAIVGDQVLQAEEHRGAYQAAPERADTTEDHHDHQRARLDPVQQARAHIAALIRDERAGEAGDRAGDDEAEQLVAVDREADRL